MTSYAVEVLSPTGWTAAPNLKEEVQDTLDAYAKAGWRLSAMTNVAGIGAVLGGAIGPYVLLVFESG